MAVGEVFMSSKRYTEEFMIEAVGYYPVTTDG